MADNPDPTDAEAVGLGFLRTEIETGLTFAGIATDQNADALKRARNRENAGKALAALMKFMPRVAMTPDERTEIEIGMERLAIAIDSIPA